MKPGTNVPSLINAVNKEGPFRGVAMNLVIADNEGNIGYKMLAPIPNRKSKTPFIGTRILDGRTSEFDWEGFVECKDLPESINPSRGFIATANNRQVPDNASFDYGANQMATGRSQRIVELI